MVATIIIAFFFSTFTLISTNMVFGSSDELEFPQTSPKHAVLVFKINDPSSTNKVYRYSLGIRKVLIPYLPKAGIPMYPLDQADETWLTAHYGKEYLASPNLPTEIKEAPKKFLLKDCAYKFLVPADKRLVMKVEIVRGDSKPADISERVASKELSLSENQIIEWNLNLDAEGKFQEKSIAEKQLTSIDTNVCGK